MVDDTKTTNLDDLETTSQHEPGLFDLLDSAELNEDVPDLIKGITLVKPTDILMYEHNHLFGLIRNLKDVMGSILSWLEGYREKRIIWNRQPIWIPIIELYTASGDRLSNLAYGEQRLGT